MYCLWITDLLPLVLQSDRVHAFGSKKALERGKELVADIELGQIRLAAAAMNIAALVDAIL